MRLIPNKMFHMFRSWAIVAHRVTAVNAAKRALNNRRNESLAVIHSHHFYTCRIVSEPTVYHTLAHTFFIGVTLPCTQLQLPNTEGHSDGQQMPANICIQINIVI